MKKKRIFFSSLVTVAAVGALSVNMAQASYLGIKNTKRTDSLPGVATYDVDDTARDAVVLHDVWEDKYFNTNEYRYKTRRAAIKNAVESNDWFLYHTANRNAYAESIIDTQEKFAQLIETQKLFEQGRTTEAWEIAQTIGIYDKKMWRKVIG